MSWVRFIFLEKKMVNLIAWVSTIHLSRGTAVYWQTVAATKRIKGL